MKKRYPCSAFLLGLAVAFLVATPGPATASGPSAGFGLQRPRTHARAPDFSLKGLSGRALLPQDLRGRVVVLNFFATWCVPCRREMPSLQRLAEKFRTRPLTVIIVAEDRGLFSRGGVRRFTEKYAQGLTVLMDPGGRARKAYEVVSLPTTYIIGRDGMIIGRVLGERVWDSEAAMDFFAGLLGEEQ